jgi:hypothetical protein
LNIATTDVGTIAASGVDAGGEHRVRPCIPDDLPAVAALFAKTFKIRSRAGAPRLDAYLKQAFLDHPWRDPRISSLVFVDRRDAVMGFIGVHPLRLMFRGEPVLGAGAGSFMVDHPEDNPLAGARLMRTFLNGPQDVSLSESANAVSQRMWEGLGGKTVAPYSMEFLRVFRPAGLALALGAQRAAALNVLTPVARGLDAVARQLVPRLRLQGLDKAKVNVVAAADSEIADALLSLSANYALRPQWERDTLLWLLSHAAEKDRFGSLTRRLVLGRNGTPVGAYLYYVRANGIALVLQMMARADAIETVTDKLFAETFAAGAVAVRGRVQPEFADALLRRRAIFLHVASTLAHSRRGDLMAAVRGGDALITGLAGESWSQLIGGAFA